MSLPLQILNLSGPHALFPDESRREKQGNNLELLCLEEAELRGVMGQLSQHSHLDGAQESLQIRQSRREKY